MLTAELNDFLSSTKSLNSSNYHSFIHDSSLDTESFILLLDPEVAKQIKYRTEETLEVRGCDQCQICTVVLFLEY